MAGNAWAIVALNDEDDTTVDYVLSTDRSTLLPVSTDIPNPAWVDDGSQTTPDANGEPRFLTQTPNPAWADDGAQSDPDEQGNPRFFAATEDNWNRAEIYLDGAQDVSTVRLDKALFQRVNSGLNIEMRRVQVDITPV